jgi:hypothetical protein
MPAGTYDMYIEQGATLNLSVTYTDNEGAPIDLTGYLGRGQIRYKPSDSTVLGAFMVGVDEPTASGIVSITLPATALEGVVLPCTDSRENVRAVYDIELYEAGGNVIRLLAGNAYISPEVTK